MVNHFSALYISSQQQKNLRHAVMNPRTKQNRFDHFAGRFQTLREPEKRQKCSKIHGCREYREQ
jgi:hypothetical protein